MAVSAVVLLVMVARCVVLLVMVAGCGCISCGDGGWMWLYQLW